MKGLSSETCALCRESQSTPAGEHVLPSWLLRRLFPVAEPGEPGYTIERNGEPVLDRFEAVRSTNALSRFKLPMCGACNTALATRFETGPSLSAVMTLFGLVGSSRDLADEEVRLAGLWLLKTTILMAHPATLNTDPGWTTLPQAWPSDNRDLWNWLRCGAQPPDGLSLWLARLSRTDVSGSRANSIGRIQLPSVDVEHDGLTKFLENGFGVADVGIACAYHPGWPIEHPFDGDGRAVRIWPRPPAALDFALLHELEGQEADDFQRLFQPGPRLTCRAGFFTQSLPPLRVGWAEDMLLGTGWFEIPGLLGASAPPIA